MTCKICQHPTRYLSRCNRWGSTIHYAESPGLRGGLFMRWPCAATVLCCLNLCPPAEALEPRDVVLIVNKNLEASRDVAETYVKLRNVPRGNVIELDLPIADDISREDYNRLLVTPLREALKDRRPRPRVLLSIYGVPLRVGAQTPSAKDREELAKLKPELDEAQSANANLLNSIRKAELDKEKDPQSPLADAIPRKQAQQHAVQQKIQLLEEQQRQWLHLESQASVDSELMLLWWDNYPLARWVVNPLYWQFPDRARSGSPPVMMTARLDGPSPKIAKRLVQDAVETEKNGGLVGKVYIDARGIPYDPEKDKGGTSYGGYDESFREAARLLREQGKMDVTLDDQDALFPDRSCTECALYGGWYAVQNYHECCRFKTGAVAWHLASFEAVSLRHPGKQWAGNLLADGAAATIGPVAEPYTIGFPKPAEFFGFLVTGEYTLVECYARSTLLTSWMMVLVGDPLYNPYAKSPKLKSWDVLPSPRGSKIGQP
jgi:uncharacterized protein (TIGR03790 family)